MCELCELCELFVKTLLYCTLRVAAAESDETIPPLSRWDFLICPQQNLFVFSGPPEISDFWGEEE